MYITYGNYTFDIGEATFVQFETRMKYSPRGCRELAVKRARIEGDLLACDEYEMTTKIAAMEDAFSYNGRDLILWHTNDTKTRHVMWANAPDTVIPPRVKFLTYPSGAPEEHVTRRMFVIEVETVLYAPDGRLFGGDSFANSSFVYWQEEIIRYGTGDPAIALQATQDGVVFQTIYPATPVKFVQRGRAIGFEGYWINYPWQPLIPYAELDPTQTIWKPGSAKRVGKDLFYYPFEWSFTFYKTGYAEVFPRSV